jgi:hypothetical protein
MAAARNTHLAVCFMGGMGYVNKKNKLCSFTVCIKFFFHVTNYKL